MTARRGHPQPLQQCARLQFHRQRQPRRHRDQRAANHLEGNFFANVGGDGVLNTVTASGTIIIANVFRSGDIINNLGSAALAPTPTLTPVNYYDTIGN